MVASPKLGINLMAENVIEPEVIFNEAVLAFDAVVAGTALELTNTPPGGTPAAGDTYLTSTVPTGAWSGHASDVAFYFNGWHFVPGVEGMRFYNEDDATFYVHDGSTWVADVGIGGGGLTLDNLSDVTITTVASGHLVQWNGTAWVNVTVASAVGSYVSTQITAGLATFLAALDLNDLTDVNTAGQTNGDVLTYNGSGWVPQALPGAATYALDDLTDVAITTPVTGHKLRHNGTNWVNWIGTINLQTGTSYTFALTDIDALVQANNASPVTFTVPANATTAFPIGSTIDLEQLGAGALTIAAAGGVTVDAQGGTLVFSAQYQRGRLIKTAINRWSLVIFGVGSSSSTQGKHTIWVPAKAMTPRISNGPSSGSVELSTNKVMLDTYDFDASTIEYLQFSVGMPKSWDEGTITAEFVWSHASTATNFGVVWGIQGLSLSDDDAMDAAFGTAQTVTDTGGTTNDLYVSGATSAVTISGTPAEGDVVIFQVYRNATNGSDTMTIDARLIGVRLFYTTNAETDA